MSKKKHKPVLPKTEKKLKDEIPPTPPVEETSVNAQEKSQEPLVEETSANAQEKNQEPTVEVIDTNDVVNGNDTVATLEARIAELEEELLRQRAETANFKRRTKQEYETNLKYANQSLIEQFLPVLDAFDRALTTQDTSDKETKQFLKGFEMIDALIKQILKKAGLSVIPTVGEQFNPYLHQAVAQGTDETKPNHEILEELQKGYKLKDRVIRASMVKTNKK